LDLAGDKNLLLLLLKRLPQDLIDFCPMVDISRMPVSRVMEGAGEDPYLGSQIDRPVQRFSR
jgi:hypothetical protein